MRLTAPRQVRLHVLTRQHRCRQRSISSNTQGNRTYQNMSRIPLLVPPSRSNARSPRSDKQSLTTPHRIKPRCYLGDTHHHPLLSNTGIQHIPSVRLHLIPTLLLHPPPLSQPPFPHLSRWPQSRLFFRNTPIHRHRSTMTYQGQTNPTPHRSLNSPRRHLRQHHRPPASPFRSLL